MAALLQVLFIVKLITAVAPARAQARVSKPRACLRGAAAAASPRRQIMNYCLNFVRAKAASITSAHIVSWEISAIAIKPRHRYSGKV
jgi:hypothetical protein